MTFWSQALFWVLLVCIGTYISRTSKARGVADGWKMSRQEWIGYSGALGSMAAFFIFGFALRPLLERYQPLFLILPLSISMALGFALYAYTGKLKTFVVITVALVLFFLYLGFGPLP